ncbi:TetR/AcrR family transcriptional regulator [Chitinophaga sp. Cy-1792]|uniref:TetR/AcrR family transcriptional regulator n=1 Tax=Chitinophaga sp. Cy-1792 TaxID=2608339 RepID=UPI00141E9196|nr:TetR/AcrR family transcriptional regulator [Chitinophaga sp. Cy-1792]NIG54425.1 TetR/AcrR family transcriptional regulator [Chitinophaga sp. Cy-1792]
MKKSEKTRNYIIEQTADIFNKKGYAGTSLSDITEATGLTKGAFYGNFADKEEVAVAVFEHNAFFLHQLLMQYFNKSYRTWKDRLCGLTDLYRDHWLALYRKGGCPLINAAIDADDTFPVLKESTAKAFEVWAKEIARIIDAGKKQQEFHPEISAKEYASLFIILIEGGILLSKTRGQSSHLHIALDRIDKIIAEEIAI